VLNGEDRKDLRAACDMEKGDFCCFPARCVTCHLVVLGGDVTTLGREGKKTKTEGGDAVSSLDEDPVQSSPGASRLAYGRKEKEAASSPGWDGNGGVYLQGVKSPRIPLVCCMCCALAGSVSVSREGEGWEVSASSTRS